MNSNVSKRDMIVGLLLKEVEGMAVNPSGLEVTKS